jgi:hypothetical protein
MATTVSVAAFRTACAAVGDAIEASDWALAAKKLGVAEAINAGLEAVAQHGSTRMERRETLKGLREAIDFARRGVGQYASEHRAITTQTRHAQ